MQVYYFGHIVERLRRRRNSLVLLVQVVKGVREEKALNDQVEIVIRGHVISVNKYAENVKHGRLLPLKIWVQQIFQFLYYFTVLQHRLDVFDYLLKVAVSFLGEELLRKTVMVVWLCIAQFEQEPRLIERNIRQFETRFYVSQLDSQ